MLFVEEGHVRYSLESSLKTQMILWAGQDKRSDAAHLTARLSSAMSSGLMPMTKASAIPDKLGGWKLKIGTWLSEAALWVKWKNAGESVAVSDSQLLAIEASEFGLVLKQYHESYVRAGLYAWCFAHKLKSVKPSDKLEPNFVSFDSFSNN